MVISAVNLVRFDFFYFLFFSNERSKQFKKKKMNSRINKLWVYYIYILKKFIIILSNIITAVSY